MIDGFDLNTCVRLLFLDWRVVTSPTNSFNGNEDYVHLALFGTYYGSNTQTNTTTMLKFDYLVGY